MNNGTRVRHYPHFANNGMRPEKSLTDAGDDAYYPAENRASRRADGQHNAGRLVARSPRMRHGVDPRPRTTVVLRAVARFLASNGVPA